jgi:hypothetical protein
MSNSSTISIVPATAPSSGLGRLIAPALLSASVLYFLATTASLPRVADASAAIDVFVAACVPGLLVVMLLWAARPAAFPPPRRRALVAVTLLGAATASILPMLFAAV